MLHKLLKKLMPRQDEFTRLFCELAQGAIEATATLEQLLSGKGGEAELRERLGRVEKSADATAAKIHALLNSSFSTPFRRGEIRALIVSLDSVVDLSEDVAKRMGIYRAGPPTPEMAELAGFAKRAAELLGQALPLMGDVSANAEAVNALCVRIHEQENGADDAHDKALRELYAPGSAVPPERARVLEKIYDLVEDVVDACEDVSNILGDIVAENA